jgi:beta-lactamase regulating signal transducer with metallopeptidase domain
MNTLDVLFSWFTVATVRGTLLALGVLALQAVLRGRMPARWRYALWLPVVFVLAVAAAEPVEFGESLCSHRRSRRAGAARGRTRRSGAVE